MTTDRDLGTIRTREDLARFFFALELEAALERGARAHASEASTLGREALARLGGGELRGRVQATIRVRGVRP